MEKERVEDILKELGWKKTIDASISIWEKGEETAWLGTNYFGIDGRPVRYAYPSDEASLPDLCRYIKNVPLKNE